MTHLWMGSTAFAGTGYPSVRSTNRIERDPPIGPIHEVRVHNPEKNGEALLGLDQRVVDTFHRVFSDPLPCQLARQRVGKYTVESIHHPLVQTQESFPIFFWVMHTNFMNWPDRGIPFYPVSAPNRRVSCSGECR